MTDPNVQPHLFVDCLSRVGKALFMLALRLVEHPPHDAIVHVEDLVGDRRLGIEQDGDQRGMASSSFQVS
jgi:hypothetical protein